MVIVCHKIRLRHKVQQQILQDKIQYSHILSFLQESIGQLTAHQFRMILTIPLHSQWIKRLHAVHSLVGPKHLICNRAQGQVGTLDLELHDQRYFSVHHLKHILELRNLLRGLTQMELLQFLISVITDFSFAAADSF